MMSSSLRRLDGVDWEGTCIQWSLYQEFVDIDML